MTDDFVKYGPEDWATAMGDKWLNQIDQFEGMLIELGQRAIDAANFPADATVLDVGCGGGPTTLAIAERVHGGGSVTGLDIAPQLIEFARTRAREAGLSNIEFVAGDATTAVLPSDFDILFSRFGVMFFDDPVAAFSNLRRALKPDGRVHLAVWGMPEANPWMTSLMQIVRQYVDLPDLDLTKPGPFSLADTARTTALLEQAGFVEVSFEPFETDVFFGGAGASAEEATSFFIDRMIDDVLAELDADGLAALRKAIESHLGEFADAQGIKRAAAIYFVRARNGAPAA